MKVLLWIYFGILALVSLITGIGFLLMLFGPTNFDFRIVGTAYYAFLGAIGIYSFNTGEKKFKQTTWKKVFYIAISILVGVVASLIYDALKGYPAPIGTSFGSLVIYFGPILYLFYKLSTLNLEEHLKTVRVGLAKEAYGDLANLLFKTKDRYFDVIVSTRDGIDSKKSIELQKVDDIYELSLKEEPGNSSKHQFSDLLSLVQYIEESTPFRVRDFV
ncbi:hypothetical protein [Aurantivibrio infirmus]